MRKVLVIAVFFLIQHSVSSQKQIFIDGSFDDWEDITPIFVDDEGDGQSNGIDIQGVWAFNDQSNLYFRFELTKEIDLQEDNELALYIDFDNDLNTGFKINGIGAELRFFFGERFGIIEKNDEMEFINFLPAALIAAPSVTGTEFEIIISRTISDSGINFSAGPTISFRLEDNSFNGDEAPADLFGIEYTLDPTNVLNIDIAELDKTAGSDFRFMTYNIENDQLFDPTRRPAFERIFQAIQPDIIALQEVRDFNSTETKNIIEEFLPGETWYHKKHGFDIVTISKYPILFSERVDGNAAFYLDVDGQEVLLINCHLPCCDNDNDRQTEVDIIMEYIRELKAGQGNYNVDQGTPIIIAGDMNFVGDSNQPYTFETGDIFFNGFYGPDFAPDWDDSNLIDANPFATNTLSNFTWINPFGSFFPGKLDWVYYTDSRLTVDNTYALYTPALTASQLAEFNLTQPDVINASDHFPVVTDFSYLTVGVDDFVELDINIYPNPASDFLFINSKENNLVSIKILNQIGQTVRSQSVTHDAIVKLDVRDLIEGSYFIILESKDGRMARPFLKVK